MTILSGSLKTYGFESIHTLDNENNSTKESNHLVHNFFVFQEI